MRKKYFHTIQFCPFILSQKFYIYISTYTVQLKYMHIVTGAHHYNVTKQKKTLINEYTVV